MNLLLTLVVIVAALGFAGTHQDGMDAATTPNRSVTAPGDGCDNPVIHQNGGEYTQDQIDTFRRVVIAQCKATAQAMNRK